MSRPLFTLAAWLLYAAVTGCTPVRTTIPAPYYMDGKKYETVGALEVEASTLCEAEARGAPLPPHTFTTDGCSAYQESEAVRSCCIRHDVAYWCGATPRIDADREFRRCVSAAGGKASLMFWAVRFGGGRFSPFPWRFGYGHPWPHRNPTAPSEPGPQIPPTTP